MEKNANIEALPKKSNQATNRESGIELLRIITMIVIVAHHFVVNSGLIPDIMNEKTFSIDRMFLLLFGWGGKTGINCFVMITGYFMCKSKITIKKFLKLILCIEFYRFIIYAVFIATGMTEFSFIGFVKAVLPISYIDKGFTTAYVIFFLFIPFLNILINGMNKKQHMVLVMLLVFVYTIWNTIGFKVIFNYVTWFSVIYLIASYIRIYPNRLSESKKMCGALCIIFLLLSWMSVILGTLLAQKLGRNFAYYLVSDSNKPLALATAVSAFMFFKNLKIGYIKVINNIAASCFGVLLIHANSFVRPWLWKDLLKVVEHYENGNIILFAILSVLAIYIFCTLIEIIRIKFIEKPFFRWFDNHYKEGREKK